MFVKRNNNLAGQATSDMNIVLTIEVKQLKASITIFLLSHITV